MNNHKETALVYFKEGGGFNCSQAVFAALAPIFDLEVKTATQVAAAFGGGIARTGGTCGAVTGALMALGLTYGATEASDLESKKLTYSKASEFLDQFRERHGTCQCRELVGCDIGTKEGLKFMKENKIAATKCVNYICDAVEIIEENYLK